MGRTESWPENDYERALGWKGNTIYESEMALFSECMPWCARKGLDTADIVRDAMFQQEPNAKVGSTREKERQSKLMGSCRSLFYTPSWNRGCACREMAEAYGRNRGHIGTFPLARDDSFAGDGLVSVAGQNRCEAVLGRRYGDARPTKVKASFDFELETEVAILDTLPSVHPRAIPSGTTALTCGIQSSESNAPAAESISALDFCSIAHRCCEKRRHPSCVRSGHRSAKRTVRTTS